ncbi:hypothetical protein RF11_04518 [Thelohanellus kitauei]|uniref:Uncharacterized protein n=1 Tax=Thelohanellus kitauei TaxID=669202 RepID=A0A0C2MU12_THEKT|nr:hypothetical protein RF11_04518 [Thelohanellus kitauei]
MGGPCRIVEIDESLYSRGETNTGRIIQERLDGEFLDHSKNYRAKGHNLLEWLLVLQIFKKHEEHPCVFTTGETTKISRWIKQKTLMSKAYNRIDAEPNEKFKVLMVNLTFIIREWCKPVKFIFTSASEWVVNSGIVNTIGTDKKRGLNRSVQISGVNIQSHVETGPKF